MRISQFLSILFPLSEDEKHIVHHTPETFLKLYTCRKVNDVWTLSSFRQKEIRSAVHLSKFHNHTHAQKLLGKLLTVFLDRYTATDTAILIPVPLSSVRKRKRGHNQVASVLSQTTFDTSRFTLAASLLVKVRDTKPQTSLKKKERKKNLQGAYVYVADPHLPVAGKHLILIDDVTTTGTTLAEAKWALKRANPASILCVAIAH